MANTEVVTNPAEQTSIEMPDGVVLTGVGGDTEAIRETLEQRYDELQPDDAPAAEAAITTATTKTDEPKKITRGQKRFDQLTAERESEKRRADAAEARTKELEAKLAPAPVVAAAEPVAAVVTDAPVHRAKPTEAEVGTKYATYSDFVEDLSDWKTDIQIAKLRTELDARSNASIEADRASRTRADFVGNTVFPAGRTVYDDFDAVLKSSTKPVHFDVQNAALKLTNPEHVIYALAKNDTEVDRLNALVGDPVALGIAVAQLMPRESVASPASTAPVVRTTNAPAPPQPVGAGSRTTSPSVEDAALISQEEYRRARGLRAVK